MQQKLTVLILASWSAMVHALQHKVETTSCRTLNNACKYIIYNYNVQLQHRNKKSEAKIINQTDIMTHCVSVCVLSYRASSALSAHRLMTRPSLHTIWSKASRIFPSGGFSSERQHSRTHREVTRLKLRAKVSVSTLSVSQRRHRVTGDKHLDMQQSCGC